MPAAVTRMSMPPNSVDRALHEPRRCRLRSRRRTTRTRPCAPPSRRARRSPRPRPRRDRRRRCRRLPRRTVHNTARPMPFAPPVTTADLAVQPAHPPPLSHDDVATCLSVRMTATIDIYDPDGYAAGPPHELFAELRRTQPVFWQDMSDEPGLLGRAQARRRRPRRQGADALLRERGRRRAREPHSRGARRHAA